MSIFRRANSLLKSSFRLSASCASCSKSSCLSSHTRPSYIRKGSRNSGVGIASVSRRFPRRASRATTFLRTHDHLPPYTQGKMAAAASQMAALNATFAGAKVTAKAKKVSARVSARAVKPVRAALARDGRVPDRVATGPIAPLFYPYSGKRRCASSRKKAQPGLSAARWRRRSATTPARRRARRDAKARRDTITFARVSAPSRGLETLGAARAARARVARDPTRNIHSAASKASLEEFRRRSCANARFFRPR